MPESPVVLSSEAAIDAVIISEVMKLATQRQRPNEGNGQGHFWVGGFLSHRSTQQLHGRWQRYLLTSTPLP